LYGVDGEEGGVGIEIGMVEEVVVHQWSGRRVWI
jgi:hypothetical protein